MGMILAALATVTAQWLPNWNRGFVRVQRTELLAIAIERLAADFAAAEFVSPNRKTDHPLFEGTELSATFVRIGHRTEYPVRPRGRADFRIGGSARADPGQVEGSLRARSRLDRSDFLRRSRS